MSKKKNLNLHINDFSDIDRMVHEPARLLILAYLSHVDNCDFLFLLNQTGLTKGNLSSHLSKLEKAGYVKIRKEFVMKIPRTLLSLTEKGRYAFKHYCQEMKTVLENIQP
jgi:DNA-binding MarR family transcriptional regulator